VFGYVKNNDEIMLEEGRMGSGMSNAYKMMTRNDQVTLYALMGEALCAIQHLEECLSTSIALKVDVGHPRNTPKAKADLILKGYRAMTLGKAIKQALKKEIYTDALNNPLKEILDERNWLVHKCIDDIYAVGDMKDLFQRLRCLTVLSHRIQRDLEDDLVRYSESLGLDMSEVRASIKEYYRLTH
jgi:hypothetical protein